MKTIHPFLVLVALNSSMPIGFATLIVIAILSTYTVLSKKEILVT